MNLAQHIVDVLLETDEVTPEEVIFKSDIGADYNDFIIDWHSEHYMGRYQTGNETGAVYYKRILVGGKPLFLGTIYSASDYRNERKGARDYWIDSVPSWNTVRTGLKRGVNKPSPFKGGPQSRKHYGHRGIVAMDYPGHSPHFNNWLEAAKYLLSLVRRNPNLKYANPA